MFQERLRLENTRIVYKNVHAAKVFHGSGREFFGGGFLRSVTRYMRNRLAGRVEFLFCL
jgi:hypothetical protein